MKIFGLTILSLSFIAQLSAAPCKTKPLEKIVSNATAVSIASDGYFVNTRSNKFINYYEEAYPVIKTLLDKIWSKELRRILENNKGMTNAFSVHFSKGILKPLFFQADKDGFINKANIKFDNEEFSGLIMALGGSKKTRVLSNSVAHVYFNHCQARNIVELSKGMEGVSSMHPPANAAPPGIPFIRLSFINKTYGKVDEPQINISNCKNQRFQQLNLRFINVGKRHVTLKYEYCQKPDGSYMYLYSGKQGEPYNAQTFVDTYLTQDHPAI